MLPSSVPERQPSTLLPLLALIAAIVWVFIVSVGALSTFWGGQLQGAISQDPGPFYYATSYAIAGALLAIPFGLLTLWRTHPRYRGIFRAWWMGSLFFLLFTLLRFVPPMAGWAANVVQILLCLLFIAGVRYGLRQSGPIPLAGGGSVLPALALAGVVALPWLWRAGLGSPLDSLLALAAGLAFGAAVAVIAAHFLLPALISNPEQVGWNITLGGWALVPLLVMMAVAFGFRGTGTFLFITVPALAWAIVAVALLMPPAVNLRGMALLTGFAAALPLLFIDPEELALELNLGGADIMAYALQAAGLMLVLGWLVSAILSALAVTVGRRIPALAWGVGAVGIGVVAILLYFTAGLPGLYGDRLFVIMADQADVSSATSIANREERLTYVYNTLTDHANTTQADLRNTLDTLQVPYRPYYLVNAIEIEGGILHRLLLELRPDVERVIDSPVLRPLPALPAEAIGDASAPDGPQWNLTQIGADRVWEEFGVRGEGIVIGESDSGVQADHPELADSYRGRGGNHDYNWYDPWYNTTEPRDLGGHGTHTTGSIVGNTVGVAPNAEWIGCVNLARNLANAALYLDCMQFMLAPFPIGGNAFEGDPTRAAHILNNSWGCPPVEGCDPNALLDAVVNLRAAGIFVVASAGNSGPACETVKDPIALYDAVFTVGASNSSGELASFSSRGPVTVDGSGRTKPDIVAPGEGVLSAYPNNTYYYADGTSMAGPHVAGVVALMWSANPALIGDIDRTEQLLIETAQPATAPDPCGDPDAVPSNTLGYGVVDAYAAVQRALEE